MEMVSVVGYAMAAVFALLNLIALWFLTRIFTQLDNLTKSDMELTKEIAALRVEVNRDHYSKKEINDIIAAFDRRLGEFIQVLKAR